MSESFKNTLKPTDKWPITTERFVAFIDIMGFKDMVAKMPHNKIYDMMKSIDEAIKDNENLASTDIDLVKTTTYSDSIMLYSKNDTKDAYDALVTSVSGLTNDLLENGIPHKGAIAFGKMTLDSSRSIFFGQPLIDAYLLQEELYYYGIIVHNTVEAKLLEETGVPFVIQYECFLKSGKSRHYTIYPMHGDGSSARDYKAHHDGLHDALEKMRYRTSGHLRRYIENTEAYLRYVAEI